MTHWPETGACCLVPETILAETHLAGKWYWQKKTKINSNFVEIRFFSYCFMSWKILPSLHYIFYFVYKQTSSAIVSSDRPITVQLSSRFLAQNWTCSNRHRFLAPEKSGTKKVWQTDQFLVPVNWYQKQAPETGQCVITIRWVYLIKPTKFIPGFSGEWSLSLLNNTWWNQAY